MKVSDKIALMSTVLSLAGAVVSALALIQAERSADISQES